MYNVSIVGELKLNLQIQRQNLKNGAALTLEIFPLTETLQVGSRNFASLYMTLCFLVDLCYARDSLLIHLLVTAINCVTVLLAELFNR